jgi:hypothetical protein
MPNNWPDIYKLTANWPAAAVHLPLMTVFDASLPILKSSRKASKTMIQKSIAEHIRNWMNRHTAAK